MHRSGIGIRPDPRAAHLGLTSPDCTPACISNQLPKTNRPRCWKVFLLQSCMMAKEKKKDIEIQLGFEPGSSEYIYAYFFTK